MSTVLPVDADSGVLVHVEGRLAVLDDILSKSHELSCEPPEGSTLISLLDVAVREVRTMRDLIEKR